MADLLHLVHHSNGFLPGAMDTNVPRWRSGGFLGRRFSAYMSHRDRDSSDTERRSVEERALYNANTGPAQLRRVVPNRISYLVEFEEIPSMQKLPFQSTFVGTRPRGSELYSQLSELT